MTSRLALAVVLAVGLVASIGADENRPMANFGPPLILRLDGVTEPNKDATRGVGFDAMSFGVLGEGRGETHWLAVTDARTVGGDHPLLGKDVLNSLAPFTPRLYLAGQPELARQFLEMPPGTAVRLEGLVNRGARTYVLRSVELRPAPDGK